MSLINVASKERPILIIGKYGTGKTTLAKDMLDEPIIVWADEFDSSKVPLDADVLIEEIHHKANTDEIEHFIKYHKGKLVLTGINKKDSPRSIVNKCKVKMAGSTRYNEFDSIAPRSEPLLIMQQDVFTLIKEFLRNKNRDLVVNFLKENKPPDVLFMNALSSCLHPNRLLFVDGKVKRRWSQKYFYEMLGYAHHGGTVSKLSIPKFAENKEIRRICRRVGLKPNEEHYLRDLVKDPDFLEFVRGKLDNKNYRMLGLGEKPKTVRRRSFVKNSELGDF
tara:strand:+ start:2498 stop:3331 length:834 start_codon:yes stop_codon:yes gene_type:complete